MTTALTAYLTKIACPDTLTTANQIYNALNSGTSSQKNTTIGTSTGYGEVYSQGTAGAWAAAGSIGSPSGNGWLWDVTTLEGQTIVAGTWTPTLRFQLSVGTSIIADCYCRAYKRSSSGVYTQIGSILFASKTITTSGNTINFTGSSLSAVSFATGDKLYIDAWLNITTNNSGSGTATIQTNESSTATSGIATAQMVTPGYQPTNSTVLVRSLHCSLGRIQ